MYLRGGERRFFADGKGMHGAGRQFGLVAIGPVNPDGLLGRPLSAADSPSAVGSSAKAVRNPLNGTVRSLNKVACG